MSKRLLLANSLLKIGGGLLSRMANKGFFFVFNYHRVASTAGPVHTAFDAGVFGPNLVQLRQQLQFLKQHTTILSESGLINALAGDTAGKGPFSMITFDDAYIDNYELVMPMLTELKVPAIFFVPALMIEERNIGWWDQIAYIIKNSHKEEIRFRGETLKLKGRHVDVIHNLHSIMKLTPHNETAHLVNELAQVAGSPPPDWELMDKELMSWDQLKEAHEAGITIGSHTCRHLVLATLSEEQQAEEIINSKALIEKKLGTTVRSLAFPVGGVAHYNQTTLRLVEKAGYDLSFSFNTGVAKIGNFNRFAVPRLGSPNDFESFYALFHFPRLMDYYGAQRRQLQKGGEISSDRYKSCQ